MYVGLKQPRGDGERYVTPARAAAKETSCTKDCGLGKPSKETCAVCRFLLVPARQNRAGSDK